MSLVDDLCCVGVLVTCDPAIKSILVKLDNDSTNSFIVEDLDDEHLVIQESREKEIKMRLDAVRCASILRFMARLIGQQVLEKNTQEGDSSGSD